MHGQKPSKVEHGVGQSGKHEGGREDQATEYMPDDRRAARSTTDSNGSAVSRWMPGASGLICPQAKGQPIRPEHRGQDRNGEREPDGGECQKGIDH